MPPIIHQPFSPESHLARTKRVNILGIGVSPVTIQDTLKQIAQWIAAGQKNYICLTTVHTINEGQRSPTIKQALNGSGLSVPDGMPLVWICRRQGFPDTQRVYGPVLLLSLCDNLTSRNYRHFFYGGAQNVADNLARTLQKRFPGLNVCGAFSPPFRPVGAMETPENIAMINQCAPDIIWVGLGSPKQDVWMANHLGQLKAHVLIGVGAAFDFHTQRMRQAPNWMQKNGLEWLFRLSQEPGRLWRRYLIGNPRFMYHYARQQLGRQRDE